VEKYLHNLPKMQVWNINLKEPLMLGKGAYEKNKRF